MPSSPRPIPLRRLPNPVAVFDDVMCFTTLSTREVAKGPYYHPATKNACTLFTMDNEMHYTAFHHDHGPFNLAYVYQACVRLNDKLEKMTPDNPLCLYTSPEASTKSNMALVACLYFVLVENEKPWDAFRAVAHLELMPFRDAGNGPRDFALSLQDCLWGVWKARAERLLELEKFDPVEYEHLEIPINGDLNILGPFIPFASPVDTAWVSGRRSGTPSRITNRGFKTVLRVFDRESVGLVVRLNEELYDARHFTDRGIDHVEMYFDDGTNPSDEMVREFIDLAERYIHRGQKVAVHCKAGLGRTGVLIGAYLIYKYSFTAPEVIGFMRVVRPGMVVGAQQHYMLINQHKWIGWAARDAYIREMQPVNPLATPPMDDDMPVFSSFTRGGTALKAGDATGQPRKIKIEPTEPLYEPPALPIDLGSGSRGTKRASTRAPLPRFDYALETAEAANAKADATIRPVQARLERSTSTSSSSSLISELDSRASKRRQGPSPSPLTLGLSSPPPSREATPEATGQGIKAVSAALLSPSYTVVSMERAISLWPRSITAPASPTTSNKSLIPTRRVMSPPYVAQPVLSSISERIERPPSEPIHSTARSPRSKPGSVGKAPSVQTVGGSAPSRIPAPATVPQSPTQKKGLGLTPARMWNQISRMTSCKWT